MERIQSALEKARNRRGEDKTDRSRPERAHETPRDKSVEDAWEALRSFTPEPKLLGKNHIFTTERGELSTHIDLLRTKILLLMRDAGWNRLAITSPNVACGKTTTCLNLAYSLARQKEQRILLIEMDLRKPNLLRSIGLRDNAPQFSKALREDEPIENHLLRLTPNLAIGANRSSVSNPSELLQSSGLRRTLDELERVYQPTLIMFDMPPILISDDVMGFVDNVDCALLMAAAGTTSIEDIDLCEKDLSERTNVLGVVLNKCRYMPKEYGYNYYEYK